MRVTRRSLLLLVALTSIVVTACAPYVAPPGNAPLRYRDEVFPGVTKTADVVYGSAPDQQGQMVTLKLDVYAPTGDPVTARPAIVWVHGGSFCCGNKSSPEIVDQANAFARMGYVNVSIDYRLTPGGCSAGAPTASCLRAILDAQHDAQAAVRFLRARAATYRVDPDRIAVAGTSAGAITALNVGFNAGDPGSSGNPGYSSAVGAAVSLSGARIFGTVEAGDAPSLLFHGTADFVVPYQWAVNTVDAAHAAGLESYLTKWDGEGHVPYLAHRDEIIRQTRNFLYWKLDLAHAAA
jgi:acetyl esterase/lipase